MAQNSPVVRVVRPARAALCARHEVCGEVQVRHLAAGVEVQVRPLERHVRVLSPVVVGNLENFVVRRASRRRRAVDATRAPDSQCDRKAAARNSSSCRRERRSAH